MAGGLSILIASIALAASLYAVWLARKGERRFDGDGLLIGVALLKTTDTTDTT